MPFFTKGGVHFMSVATLFFVVSLMLWSIVPSRAEAGFLDNIFKFFGGESQAAIIDAAPSEGLSIPLLGSDRATTDSGGLTQDDTALVATQDNALVSTRNPLGILPSAGGSDQIVVYTVQAGDTPGAIASRFGISLNTLLWANNLRSAAAIHGGDSLVILPVTGVQYEVKKGDTLEVIAKKFGADAMDIMSFNGLAIGETLRAGMDIIIPDGELASPAPASSRSAPSPARFAGLPELKGFLLRPIIGGRNVRATRANPHGLHGFNGVDLANTCGMPVIASAAGSVIISRTSGWNGGYGRYIVLSHVNGVQTLYAHLSAIHANVGSAVAQGTQIGLIGSTGNSTGCHVHFEVRGAKNPF